MPTFVVQSKPAYYRLFERLFVRVVGEYPISRLSAQQEADKTSPVGNISKYFDVPMVDQIVGTQEVILCETDSVPGC